jgi:signal transduction histidine kinase
LNAWNLSFYTSGAGFGEDIGRGAFLNLLFVLVAVGIALGGLATYFWREHSREMREAEQRVNFVNQVSHELKTPLTNIRLYAELLKDSLPEDDPRGERYTEVILSESQRLSRLIGNILSFGRKQQEILRVQKSPGSVDVSIRSMLDLFCPSLDQKGIRVTTAYGADAEVRFDPDALQQILGNLISNVEKYAADGKLMEVTSNQEPGRTTITVSDRGPGIPLRQREKIFQPFYRLSNRTSDGVAGTGIGLSIAKDLAQIHGGDLVLLRTLQGASFQLTLHTPGKDRNDSTDS